MSNLLPWAQEEHGTVGHLVCPDQFVDGVIQVARGAGMSASAGKVSGGADGQRNLKSLKNRYPTRRIWLKTQDIEVAGRLPWLASNYSDHPHISKFSYCMPCVGGFSWGVREARRLTIDDRGLSLLRLAAPMACHLQLRPWQALLTFASVALASWAAPWLCF
jgi:hypothetical protein